MLSDNIDDYAENFQKYMQIGNWLQSNNTSISLKKRIESSYAFFIAAPII
jgi:hypothetical protein